MDEKDIKNFTLEELKEELVKIKRPAYRATQIFFWIYKRGVDSFEKMNNIPKALQNRLSESYCVSTIELTEHLISTDGTEKFLFKLADGNFIESVLIYAKDRKTICLSTQVGCKFACPFCASGQKGFIRNLVQSEIINQILFLQYNLKHKITNFVFMGMGEPLDNYRNLSKAITIMNTKEAMDIGARRITVSTCGIVPAIERLKDLGLQINLSISLHAANDKLRDELVPVNKQYPLKKLVEACQGYINRTKRFITLEYVLIKGKNDSLKDADGLTTIAKRLKVKVNLISCSPIPNLNFHPSQQKDIILFKKRLVNKGVSVTMRESKGKDIMAACGQLAGRFGESAEKMLF